MIQALKEISNKIFRSVITGTVIGILKRYFSFDHKRASNLGKLYLLPKIHKRRFNLPGRPVISNCRTPTVKASEFLDSHLKTIVQGSWCYIKDSGDFINKVSQFGDIPENVFLVAPDAVALPQYFT